MKYDVYTDSPSMNGFILKHEGVEAGTHQLAGYTAMAIEDEAAWERVKTVLVVGEYGTAKLFDVAPPDPPRYRLVER